MLQRQLRLLEEFLRLGLLGVAGVVEVGLELGDLGRPPLGGELLLERDDDRQDVERGLLPNDRALLSALVEDVCFRNARDYFQFEL